MAHVDPAAVFEQLDALNIRAAARQVRRTRGQQRLSELEQQFANAQAGMSTSQRTCGLNELRAKITAQHSENAKLTAGYIGAIRELEALLLRVEEAVSKADTMALTVTVLNIEISNYWDKRFVILGAPQIEAAFYAEIEALGKSHIQGGARIIGVTAKESQHILCEVAQRNGFIMRPAVRLEFDKDDSARRWPVTEVFAVGDETEVREVLERCSRWLTTLHKLNFLSQDGGDDFNEGQLHLTGQRLVSFQLAFKREDFANVLAESASRANDAQRPIAPVARSADRNLISETELPDILLAARKCLHEVSGGAQILSNWDSGPSLQNVEQKIAKQFATVRRVMWFFPTLVAAIVLANFSLMAAVSSFFVCAIVMLIAHVEVVERIVSRLRKKALERDGGRDALSVRISEEYDLNPGNVTLGLVHALMRTYNRGLKLKVREVCLDLERKAAEQAASRATGASGGASRPAFGADECIDGEIMPFSNAKKMAAFCSAEIACPSPTTSGMAALDHDLDISSKINPATGLPMLDGVFDVSGNVYGMSNDDIWSPVADFNGGSDGGYADGGEYEWNN